jgi:hypothetical protein
VNKKSFLIPVLPIMLFLVFFIANPRTFHATASFIGSTETVTLYSVEDSYVNASSPDTNYGDAQYLYVSGSSTHLSQALIYVKFDLSSIPQNAHIVSAKLKLCLWQLSKLYYGIQFGGDAVDAYYCSDNSWAELGITWNNRPKFDFPSTASWAVSEQIVERGYKSWDVTNEVQKSLPLMALTEVLRFSSKHDGYGFAGFISKEQSLDEPKLEIEYTTEPVFKVQIESAQDVEATPYFLTLRSNRGLISFANKTFHIPYDFDVEYGSYPVEYSGGYDFVRWETTGGITVLDKNAKSTMATISGNGTLRAVGNAGKLEYSYDNGKPSVDYSLPAGQICAELFTPLLSGQLLSVRYYLNNVPLTTQSTFRVHILNAEKEDLITPFEATPTSNGWFEVDLITYNISITEGTAFYVAFEFLANETLCVCGCNSLGRSYSWDGTNWFYSDNQLMIRATVLNSVYLESDGTPPEIGVPSQNPSRNNVKSGEEVKVSVNVTDIESGVKNVTLFYTTNNGSSWEKRPMSYIPFTGLCETTIPGQEDGTLVRFRIEAYNNAGKKAIKDDIEPYHTGQVIPELLIVVILLTFIVATLIILAYYKNTKNPVVEVPFSEDALRALPPFEFQNWVCNRLFGRVSARKTSDMGIDGYTFEGHPIQIKQSDNVGKNVVDNFETSLSRKKKNKGIIVGFSFTKGAYEEIARAKLHGNLDIQALTVKDLIANNKRE